MLDAVGLFESFLNLDEALRYEAAHTMREKNIILVRRSDLDLVHDLSEHEGVVVGRVPVVE